MNVDIKLLTILDINRLEKLFDFNKSIRLGFKNFYLKGSTHKSFGLFENSELIDVVSIIENKTIPAWSLSKTFTKSNIFFAKLFSHVIDFEEKCKRYQFFTINDDENFSIGDFRYKKYLEHIIPPKCLTNFENIDHDILEYQTHDTVMFLHLWVLENEYRSF